MLYLDSADTSALPALLRTGVFAGVTTNPLILRRSGLTHDDLPTLYRELTELGAERVFMQTKGTTTRDMLESAHRIQEISPDIVVKVPATPDGYATAHDLCDTGHPALITAVYHPAQAACAAAVGAWGIAPYVGRMSDQGADWRQAVSQMLGILSGTSTRVLAASIRSRDVVTELLAMGVHDVTVALPVATDVVSIPQSTEALEEFEEALP